ncbi:alpha/beta-Hydrolase [Purpureocillium lavendulum]|uniref:Alpha/beta-Hydrolase n=1 Tax=Purpureocillium lavendulum TaxID=1247861 RepID=A0AB34FKI5_9HYPO|nr:alpha/beta-Hydrolase [Purpureocillium lavendulum]
MPELPTLVFVPGAWHKPSCYDKVIALLRDQYKLKCVAITLPSTTGDPSATFKDDLDAARATISGETTRGRDVVVIAHSYGGMVGNSAIKGFARPRGGAAAGASNSTASPSPADDDSSESGHAIGLILIASGFTFTGLAFMDPFFGRPPPAWRVNSETGFAELVADPRDFFYHDLPSDEAEYWASQLTPQSLKALFEGAEHAYAGWQDVPAWLIGTTEDRGLPLVVQRMQVGMAREMGAQVEYRELTTSHSPFLSRPEDTADIVAQAVGAFAGTSIAKGTQGSAPRNEMLPAPRLWQPVTWFRFGLPLVFGRILGRSILIFNWGWRLWRSR